MTQPRTISTRATSPVNTKLNRQLIAYAAAASAAGVGLLATPQIAEAKIVYTPANVAIDPIRILPIDLDNDGNPDFAVRLLQCAYRTECLVVNPWVEGNGIKGFNGRASVEPLDDISLDPRIHDKTF